MKKRLAGILLILCGAAAGMLYWNGDEFVTDTARRILQDAGYPDIAFTVSKVTVNDVTLKGIRIGKDGALNIPKLSAVFTWQELYSGKVGALTIDGLSLTATMTATGISFGELDTLLFHSPAAPGSSAKPETLEWPFRQVALRNAQVDINQNNRRFLALRLDGTVERDDSGTLSIDAAKVTVKSDILNIAAIVTATVSPDRLIETTLELAHGKIEYQNITTTAQSGTLDLSIPIDRPTEMTALANLSVSLGSLPFNFQPMAELSLTYSDNYLLTDISFVDRDHSAAGELIAAIDMAPATQHQTAEIDFRLNTENTGNLPRELLPIPLDSGSAGIAVRMEVPIEDLQAVSETTDLPSLMKDFPDVIVDLSASGLRTPLFPGTLDFKAPLSLRTFEDDVVKLEIMDDATATFAPEHTAIIAELLGPVGQSDNAAPIVLVLHKQEDPVLTVSVQEAGADVSANGSLSVSGGGLPSATGAIDASVRIGSDAVIASATVNSLGIQIPELDLKGLLFSDIAIDANGKGIATNASGSMHLKTLLSGGQPDAATIQDGVIDVPLSWDWDQDQLSIWATDCARFTFERADVQGVSVQSPLAHYCLDPVDLSVSFMRKQSNAVHWDVSVATTVSHSGGPVLLSHSSGFRAKVDEGKNELSLKAAADPDGLKNATAHLSLSSILLPTASTVVEDIDVKVKRTAIARTINGDASFKLHDVARPNRFGGAGIASQFTFTDLEDIRFGGTITVLPSDLTLEWEGTHHITTRSGTLTTRALPFTFDKDVNSPLKLLPLLKPYLHDASGQLLAAASVDWNDWKGCANGDALFRRVQSKTTGRSPIPIAGVMSAGQIGLAGKVCFDLDRITDQGGQILLENVNFVGDQLTAQALNAKIDIDTFIPFTTQADQLISIGVIDPGFPMTDGIATFDISTPNTLNISTTEFNWIGGKISVDPMRISPESPLKDVSLKIDGARVQDLSALLPDVGISGEGLLDGQFPIHMEERGPAVRNGFLEGRGPGVIRYRPDRSSGNETSTVDDALSNLQYSILRLDLDGGLQDGAKITLHVEGKNPDYYDGVPVVLDLNLTGPVGTMMNDGLAAYKVPNLIVERMQRFGQLD